MFLFSKFFKNLILFLILLIYESLNASNKMIYLFPNSLIDISESMHEIAYDLILTVILMI